MKPEKYTPTLDPELAKLIDALDADAREFYEERAGIREHEGSLPRAQAEVLAWTEAVAYLKQRSSQQ